MAKKRAEERVRCFALHKHPQERLHEDSFFLVAGLVNLTKHYKANYQHRAKNVLKLVIIFLI